MVYFCNIKYKIFILRVKLKFNLQFFILSQFSVFVLFWVKNFFCFPALLWIKNCSARTEIYNNTWIKNRIWFYIMFSFSSSWFSFELKIFHLIIYLLIKKESLNFRWNIYTTSFTIPDSSTTHTYILHSFLFCFKKQEIVEKGIKRRCEIGYITHEEFTDKKNLTVSFYFLYIWVEFQYKLKQKTLWLRSRGLEKSWWKSGDRELNKKKKRKDNL